MWTIYCTTTNLGSYGNTRNFSFAWNSTLWQPQPAMALVLENLPLELFFPWKKTYLQVWEVAGGTEIASRGKASERQPSPSPSWDAARNHLETHFRDRTKTDHGNPVEEDRKREIEFFLGIGTILEGGNYQANSENWPGVMASFSNQGALVGKEMGGISIHPLSDFRGGNKTEFDEWLERVDQLDAGRLAIIPVPEGWISNYKPNPELEGREVFSFEIRSPGGIVCGVQAKACCGRESASIWKTTIPTSGGYLKVPDDFNGQEDITYLKKNWRKNYLNDVSQLLNPVVWFADSALDLPTMIQLVHDRADPGWRISHAYFDMATAKAAPGSPKICSEIFKMLTHSDNAITKLGVNDEQIYKGFLANLRTSGGWVRMVSEAVDLWGGDEYRGLAVILREERIKIETFSSLVSASPPLPGFDVSPALVSEIQARLKERGLANKKIGELKRSDIETLVKKIDGRAVVPGHLPPDNDRFPGLTWIKAFRKDADQAPTLDEARKKLAEISEDEDFLLDLFIRQWNALVLFAANGVQATATARWQSVIEADNLSEKRTLLQKVLRDSGRNLSSRLGDGLTGAALTALAIDPAERQDAASEAKAVRDGIIRAMEKITKRLVDTGHPPFLLPTSPGQPDTPPPDGEISKRMKNLVLHDPGPNGRRRTMPQPLRMDIPRWGQDKGAQEKFEEELSGVLVMLSRRDNSTKWHCLNASMLQGKILGVPDVSIESRVLSPYQLNTSGGILQGVVEYQEEPIAVDLNKTRGTAVDKNPAAPGTSSGLTFKYTQLAKPIPGDWGLIPFLAYQKPQGGASNRYRAAWIPVHNSGALPPELVEGDPRQLKKPAALTPPSNDHRQRQFAEFSEYLRRVPVGNVRFTGPLLKPSERSSGARKPAWQEFNPTLAPSGVASLTKELLRHYEAEKESDPTVYLLWSNENFARTGNPAIDFYVRPPATEPLNWRRGFRTAMGRAQNESEEKFETFLDNVSGDYDWLVENPSEGMDPNGDEQDPFGKASDLIDDYAVIAAKVAIHELEPPNSNRQRIVRTPVKDFILGLDNFKPPVPMGQLPHIKRIQKVFSKPIGAGPLDSKFKGRIVISRDPQGEGIEVKSSEPDANGLTSLLVRVGAGRICMVTVHPLISKPAYEHFDEIHPQLPEEINLGAFGKVYRIPGTERVTYFEAVSVPGTLPSPEELYSRLNLELNEARKLKISLAPIPDPLKAGHMKPWGHNWAYVGDAKAFIQRWSVQGSEQNWKGDLPALCANASLIGPAIEQFDTLKTISTNELGDFGNVSDNDVEHSPRSVSFVSLLGKKGNSPADRITIHEEPGDQEQNPSYIRATIWIRSRYSGLPGFDGEIKALHTLSKDTETLSTPYNRYILPGRLRSPLGPPRVKMLIPLIDDGKSEEENEENCGGIPGGSPHNPGFVALCVESLVSPFHLLEGNISRTLYSGSEYPEMGFDPITSPKAPDGPLLSPQPLLGRPFGLTVEREASDSNFPFSAYFFDCPPLPENWTKDGRVHDLFMTLSFRWKIWPGIPSMKTMDASEEELTGLASGDWQVRLLARQNQVFIRKPGGGGTPILKNLNSFKFDFNPSGNPEFYSGEGDKIEILRPETPSSSGIVITFAFLSWSMIPDMLGEISTKRPEGIHLLPEIGNAWKKVWQRGDGSGEDASSGQFVMIMARKGELGNGDTIRTLEQFLMALFPDQPTTGNKYREARMMLNRIFRPIPRK